MKEIRAALSALVTHGADAVWLPQVQPLLELPAVQARLHQLGEDRPAEAVLAELREAVEDLGQSQYRHLLSIVLGLRPEWASLSVGQRRAIAGREFRGGERPVGGGTIRQHHEPKALDQLASVIGSDTAPSDARALPPSLRSQAGAVEWHPLVRQAWAGERLCFWRLSTSYPRADLVPRVSAVMDAAEVAAWTAYKLLGSYDMLIRTWLPDTAQDFERKLHVAMEGDRDLILDRFEVDDIIRHWPWAGEDGSVRSPAPSTLESAPSRREIELLETGALDAAAYGASGVLTRVPEGEGIAFAATIDAPRHSISTTVSSLMTDRIAHVLDSASARQFSEISLYRGLGFAAYLIQGRVRADYFHELDRSLLEPINEVTRIARSRVHAFVMSAPRPLVSVEGMRTRLEPESDPGVTELLHSGEGQNLEVKAWAFHDVRSWLLSEDKGELATSDSAIQALMRAIVASLNSGGGTVVIGALEEDRTYRGLPRLAGLQRIGGFVVVGIDPGVSDVDRFHSMLTGLCHARIEPDPTACLRIRFERIGERSVCVIDVHSSTLSPRHAQWFYYVPRQRGTLQFYVRQSNRTIQLTGPEADAYKVERGR